MSIMKSLVAGTVFGAFLVAAIGCDVDSKHPLSDEKTSTPDAKLLGDWRQIEESAKGDSTNVWRVAKHPKSDKTFMAFMLPGELEDFVDRLFTTEIDGKKYLSWGGVDRESGETGYFVCRYEMPDSDSLNVTFFSEDAIGKAIAEKRLSGEIKIVTTQKKGFLGKKTLGQSEEVNITADPKELRAFLKANGDSCFPKDKEKVLRFKRLK